MENIMAKGKRSSGNNYTSKGERRNVKKWITKAMRRETPVLETALNKQQAKAKGRRIKEGGLHKETWVDWSVGVAEYRRKFNDQSQ